MGKTKDVSHQELMEVINSFDFGGKLEEVGIFGNGHINETYCAVFSTEAGQKRYILQKMNKQIFKDPVGLMENISGVTSWLKKKILENGGDAERETLNIVNDRAGAPYFVDKEGEYWRAYLFIEDATCFDQVENDEDFYQSALAFGNFQRLLADYPADTLHETIPDFHIQGSDLPILKRLWKRMHADGRLMFRRRYSLSWKESSWPIHLWIYRMQVSCLFV